MTIDEILHIPPYSLDRDAKRKMLNERIGELTRYHYEHCELYRKMMDAVGLDINNLPEYDELPFLPVRLFKEFELRSVPKEEIAKTMTSSGTTGQQKSHFFGIHRNSPCADADSGHFGCDKEPQYILCPWCRNPWFLDVR